MDGDDWRGPGRQLAEANARAEHWAAQADRLARQVERMREAMEAVAGDLVDFPVAMPDPYWDGLADRLRAAAKGGNDVE